MSKTEIFIKMTARDIHEIDFFHPENKLSDSFVIIFVVVKKEVKCLKHIQEE